MHLPTIRFCSVFALLCVGSSAIGNARQPLTFEERVKAQPTIERLAGSLPAATEDAACGTKGVPLSRYLRPDGTLALPPEGIPGSIDPAGFRLTSGPGETPRFEAEPETGTPEATEDDCWDTRFRARGLNDGVYALAWDGTNLYAGGAFTMAGSVTANHIAKWDGTTWSALGTGMSADVYALALNGTDLYAGGLFTKAGEVTANHIARWDGTSWRALGTGTDGAVRAMVWGGTNLYAGGQFAMAGGTVVYAIAKWDGTAWSALGTGMNYRVYALAWDGTNLYAGGLFSTAGGVAANSIAKWDGSVWSALGTGLNNAVNALTWDGDNLYAGGDFTSAGGIGAHHVVKWDGAAWSEVGAGINDPVQALSWNGANLYAASKFSAADGSTASHITRWNGTTWSAMGIDLNGPVDAFCWEGSDLLAGGFFTSTDGIVTKGIAKWNGADWSPLAETGEGVDYGAGSGIGNGVLALAWDGANLYAGGRFQAAGAVVANNIAKWDGTTWSPLGSGTNDVVRALAWDGANLYAGGDFTLAGDAPADYVARWDGATWSPLGTGMDNYVISLAWSGTDLYVGGAFTSADGILANSVAKWDGTTWTSLGTGIELGVEVLTWGGGNLYVGGFFGSAGGVTVNRIAKWDGTTWSPLGTGMDLQVYGLAWDGTNLYAAGDFTTAGGVAAKHIAKWNGTVWSPMGMGIDGHLNALSWDGATLYAGGYFAEVGDVVSHHVALWNGTGWSSLGTGMNENVMVLASDGDSLWAGGLFTTAGGTASSHIARWKAPVPSISGSTTNSCPSATVTLTTGSFASYQWNLDGQPIAGALSASYNVTQSGNYSVTVTNVDGCSGTSATKTVTISPCVADLHYDSSFNPATTLTQVCGDGDGVVEPGEEWQVTMRLKNTGNQTATNAAANLTVNAGSAVAATVTGNPGAFGTVANGGGTSTATYRFVVSPGAPCVSTLTFDVTDIVSSEGSYPSQISAFSIPVGSSSTQNETATQQTSPLNATGATATSALGPAFTLAGATSATLSYAHAYTPLPATATLFSDEFSAVPGSNGWTVIGNVTSSGTVPTDSCAGGGGNYARLDGAGPSMTRAISTSGKSNVALTLDYRYASMGAGKGIVVEYSTSGIGGPWTTQWSKLAAGNAGSLSWGDDCGRTVVFPSSCENNPNFALQVRSTGSSSSSLMVDHLRITADALPSDWTSSAKVELVDPSNAVTMLKAYGATDGSPHNVQPYYTGAGTYQVRLSESAGGTATVTSASLSVTRNVTQCNVSSCSGTSGPPPVGNGKAGTTATTFTKNASTPQQVDVTYDATHCTGERAVILYGTIGSYSGYVGCAQTNAGNTGTTTVNTTGLDNVWFNIVWANGTTAGNPGNGYNGTADVPRTWPAAGRCGITQDDAGHATCP